MTKAEILACLSKRHAKIVASPYTLGKSNLDAIERTIEALDSPYSFYAVLSAEERAQVRAQWQALTPHLRAARKKSRSKLRIAPELPTAVLKFFGSSECLPHRPRAANDYTQGIQRVSWKKAQGLRSVELNPPAHIYWLVFDCDHSEHERWKTAGLPEPAFITINPQNGHHHVVYRLSTPVCRSECARARPLAYLRAVEKAMRVALGGDRGYARLLTKNPLHPAWMAIRPQVMPSYSLAQLAATVDLKNTDEEPGTKKGRTSRQFAESLSTTAEGGRNRALFDAVRHRPATEKDIRSYAERCNAMLPDEFQQFVSRHAGAHQDRFTRHIHAVNGEDVLCQIDSYGYDGHGLPLPKNKRVDERSHFPSWHCVAVLRKCARRLGRGSPFHSLDRIAGTAVRADRTEVTELSLD